MTLRSRRIFALAAALVLALPAAATAADNPPYASITQDLTLGGKGGDPSLKDRLPHRSTKDRQAAGYSKYLDWTYDVRAVSRSGKVTKTNRSLADIELFETEHVSDGVLLASTFRSLRKSGFQAFGFRIRTNKGFDGIAVVQAASGYWGGGNALIKTKNLRQKSCAELDHWISYESDFILVWVPRACIGSAKWVRTGFTSATSTSKVLYLDDARRTSFQANPILGPKIFRD